LAVAATLGIAALVLGVALRTAGDSNGSRVAVGTSPGTPNPNAVLGDCPSAVFNPRGAAEGLPSATAVTKSAVDSVISTSGYHIVQQFHANDMSVTSITSGALATLPSGHTAIVDGPIYVINVMLASAASCPTQPTFYNGVPLIFHINPLRGAASSQSPRPTADAEECTNTNGTMTAWDHVTLRPIQVNRAYYCRRLAELQPARDAHLSGTLYVANGKVVAQYYRITEVTTVDAHGHSIGTAVESKDPVPINQLPPALQAALRNP
jgi:hypothetical protein